MRVPGNVVAICAFACVATETVASAGAVPEAERAALVKTVRQEVERIGLNAAQTNDSGDLGWGEGRILQAIMATYLGTGDTKWLQMARRHIDTALCFLTDHDDDGFLSWHTNYYTREPALMKARPSAGNVGNARISVQEKIEEKEPWNTRTVNHPFRVIFLSRNRFTVVDEDTEMTALLSPHSQPGLRWLPIQAYEPGKTVWRVRGLRFTITGQPEAGDSFVIIPTPAPKYDSVVHDGMMTYPMAQFARLVKADAQLEEQFGDVADGYLTILERHFFAKWDRKRWVELDGDRGLYWRPADRRGPERRVSLPMNQYTAFGRTIIELHRATKKPEYLDRASKMARMVKSLLREKEGAYWWYYSEPVAEWDVREKPAFIEHTHYADMDVGFMIDAFEAGIVFDREDMRRLTDTFVKVMWNGSMEAPTVAGGVDGKNGTSEAVAEFVRLSQFDSRVWRICDLIEQRARKAGRRNMRRAAWLLACAKDAP